MSYAEYLEAAKKRLDIENRGHAWRKEDGEIDIFGYSAGTCNGPICDACGYSFCWHCQESPGIDCPGTVYELSSEAREKGAAT